MRGGGGGSDGSSSHCGCGGHILLIPSHVETLEFHLFIRTEHDSQLRARRVEGLGIHGSRQNRDGLVSHGVDHLNA